MPGHTPRPESPALLVAATEAAFAPGLRALARLEELPVALTRALAAPLGIGLCADAPAPLLPEELGLLGGRAHPQRRHALALGRTAARHALVALGASPAPIGRGPRGEPLWPPGLVGSLTHAGSIGLAVVGDARQHAGMGLDLEHLAPGPSSGARRRVLTPAEATWVHDVDEARARRRAVLVFSAKEAVFKATYPLAGVWLGFQDAELVWQPEKSAFCATLRVSPGGLLPAGARLTVWLWLAGDAAVVAFTALPAPG